MQAKNIIVILKSFLDLTTHLWTKYLTKIEHKLESVQSMIFVQKKYFKLFTKPFKGVFCSTKKKLGTLLVIISCLTLVSSNVLAFTDIAADHPNRAIFEHLRDVNIMTPFDDGAFHGEILISKIQALTFALRAGGISILNDFDATTLPKDINPNEWYAPVIARAQSLNIISTKEFFAPSTPVTKAEFLAFIFRAAQIQTYRQWDDKDFIAEDIDTDAWFAADFWYAQKYHIAHTDFQDNYLPFATINREQAAIILYRHLRIWHGDQSVKLFALLQGEMQIFMTKLKQGRQESSMIHLQEIRILSRKIATVKNDKNAIAAKHLSKSFDNLVLSLRAFRYQKNLRALEYINLSIKYAEKAAKKSEAIKPIADEMQKIIATTLFESSMN